MEHIKARGVNDAWYQAVVLIRKIGEECGSRNGRVLVAPCPVITTYTHPNERVLFDPLRDANPIFHLHEALWMLAGRDDARWLDQFVHDFSERYAEKDGHMHGAYGYRWRRHFYYDQLKKVIEILKDDPNSRQAVIQMWDADEDLGIVGLKDRPCNTQIYLRMDRGYLDMAVTCRSNDIVWGCYGANAVHFSILQEYLATMLDIPMGRLTQFSWNWHMYISASHLAHSESAYEYISKFNPAKTIDMINDPEHFDTELIQYCSSPTSASPDNQKNELLRYHNTFFTGTAFPMWEANRLRKRKDWDTAFAAASAIEAPDWRKATIEWLQRRLPK